MGDGHNHNHNHSHSHGHSHQHQCNDTHCEEENVDPPTDLATTTGQYFNAVRYGLKPQVTAILTAHPEIVNEFDSMGHTAVHWAAKRGDIELLQILFDFGATLNIPANSESRMLAVHWAAGEGKISSLRFLLDLRPQDINSQDGNGCTPVAVAAQRNQTACCAFLFKNGADMTITDCNGDTALHWAAYKGYMETVGLLCYCMPREVNMADSFGQTPLHLAALRGHEEVAEYLVLDCGADMQQKDRNGSTPMELALNKQQLKTEWTLRRLANAKVCCGLLRGLTTKRLKEGRIMSMLLCGSNETEISRWSWRIVFSSNLFASLSSVYFATSSHLADLSYLHLFNSSVQLLWWIFFIMCLWKSPSYCRDDTSAALLDTGRTAYTYDAALEAIGKSFQDEGHLPAVCHTCHICKPLRSKHCKLARRCVNKFDHFCPFVGNTVGRDNYKYFVGLLSVHVLCATGWEVAAWYLWTRTTISWGLFIYMIYAILWLVMVCCLLNYHLQLLATNLTTNEQINASKYSYMRNAYNLMDNPFDRGSYLANFIDGLFPSPKVYYTREDVVADRTRSSNKKSSGGLSGSNSNGNSNSNGHLARRDLEMSLSNSGDDKIALLEKGHR